LAILIWQAETCLTAVARTHQQIASKGTVKVDDKLKKAMSDYNSGALDACEGGLKEIIGADCSPVDKARAFDLLGKVYHRQSKVGLAEEQYKKVLSLDPKLVEATFNLAIALFDQGNFSEAYRVFEEAVQKRPSSSDYQYNLAVTAERLGKKDEAQAG